jgi:Tfp pilus assembly protein PilZ
VTLYLGQETHELLTEDVSYRGVFVRTDRRPRLRQLVKLKLELGAGDEFTTHAMTVWVVPPGGPAGRVAGVGLQFYGVDKNALGRWERFVSALKDEPAPVASPPSPEPIRRRFHRFAAAFKVVPRNIADLLEMYTRDVSVGGMFLVTAKELAVGAEIALDVIHPVSHAVFALSSVVRRVEAGKGLGVEFTDLDDARREEFLNFATVGMAELDAGELVESNDPELA